MTSAPPNSLSGAGGKHINLSSTHSPVQQQQSQVTSPSFEGSRRSASNSNQSNASPRNNQGQRKQHKNARRPRLANEDAMAESVSPDLQSQIEYRTELGLGSHEERKQPARSDLNHPFDELLPPSSTSRLSKYYAKREPERQHIWNWIWPPLKR